MKEFDIAVKTAEGVEDTEKYQFTIKGKDTVFTAYKPTPAQLAVVLSKVGRHTSMTTKVAGVIDFFVAVLDEGDAAALTERLLDRDDMFELEDVERILAWLVEEWGGHPTQEPSGSLPSPTPTGPTSTPQPEGPTPSDYLSTVS